jgi:hypothetical protein
MTGIAAAAAVVVVVVVVVVVAAADWLIVLDLIAIASKNQRRHQKKHRNLGWGERKH